MFVKSKGDTMMPVTTKCSKHSHCRCSQPSIPQ